MPTGCVALLVTLGMGPVLEEQPLGHVPATVDVVATEPLDDALDAPPDEEPEPPEPEDDEVPLVTTLEEALAGAPEVEVPPRPTVVRHRVRPRERVGQIAVRYGVTPEELWKWNKKLDPQAIYPGHRHLKVRARRLPPPRRKVRYRVQEGESWMDVSAKFQIEHRDLHAYNWSERDLETGMELVLWVDPGWPRTIHPGAGPPIPEHFELPTGARSVGRPNRGRLEAGILLPPSELYTRKVPSTGLYGSSHTIEQIHRAFAIFRHDAGYEGEVIIGAISRRRGGRFSPHLSHQSGRDIDIRLPLWPTVPPSISSAGPDEIDWYATWYLVKSFIATGEVATIFLDVSRHRNLYEAARAMGETPDSLESVIKWPRWSGGVRPGPVVRHSEGHDTHIHVRIKCGPDEPRCKRR
ncbi:penicillin-insensitive murein endopeptidase [Paraliomyxa miuraensis]|uniref:penicillin-insensitive murein endopeptidase n=1 Tax=Paraliomyxa miuraensis TaxID=376150 RepID=UPI002255A47A|nr:penicillin-insensitive murein endopeptidase [Paraliomyxa miuraensis]MCX4241931.1 penicillin-insensitive murein endopeptidase [Paraliomyxa miuraensis]